MIILCGIPTESPMKLVSDQLKKMETPYMFFNQRNFSEIEMAFEFYNEETKGYINFGGKNCNLEDIEGVYIRLMDTDLLPELKDKPNNSPLRKYCVSLHDTLVQWCEITNARVVNRFSAMNSNSSKPYQAQLIRKHGFKIPSTLITNDPELVKEFYEKHSKIIYKSISSVRSIVQTFNQEDFKRIEQIRWCPVQFQELLDGIDVRVHVINKKAFATSIKSKIVDYRYAHKYGSEPLVEPVKLSEDLSAKCIGLANALGLPFVGIDLKITKDNAVFCFEVNPSPAFNYYESETNQPISMEVAKYLCGVD